MSAIHLVRSYFPSATDEEADALLWNATAFPVCSYDQLCSQLADLAVKANCFDDAMRISAGEFDVAYRESIA